MFCINSDLLPLQVLSRAHAVLTGMAGHVLVRDTGSRNGTFVNGIRLSKPCQESEDIRIYSQDLIRQVEPLVLM